MSNDADYRRLSHQAKRKTAAARSWNLAPVAVMSGLSRNVQRCKSGLTSATRLPRKSGASRRVVNSALFRNRRKATLLREAALAIARFVRFRTPARSVFINRVSQTRGFREIPLEEPFPGQRASSIGGNDHPAGRPRLRVQPHDSVLHGVSTGQ